MQANWPLYPMNNLVHIKSTNKLNLYNTTVSNAMAICLVIVLYILVTQTSRGLLIKTMFKVLTVLEDTTQSDKLFHIGISLS